MPRCYGRPTDHLSRPNPHARPPAPPQPSRRLTPRGHPADARGMPRHTRTVLATAILTALGGCGSQQSADPGVDLAQAYPLPAFPVQAADLPDGELRADLLAMHRRSLAAREHHQGKLTGDELTHLWRLDMTHAARLKQLIVAHGWPDADRVGAEAVNAAVTIVRNAPQDLELMSMAVASLEGRLETAGVAPEDFAVFVDRARVARGEPQYYGTIMRVVPSTSGSRVWPEAPIEAPEALDDRRAEIGLAPHAEFIARLAAID